MTANTMRWVAVSFGALDVRGIEGMPEGAEFVVTPVFPSEPVALVGEGAKLWRRLVSGPIDDTDLTPEEQHIVREMADTGVASSDCDHSARVTEVDPPWLSSPFHELVYALLHCVARDQGIDHVFIKGPVLHAQGLRDREHSGDVDVWVRPGDEDRLARAMGPWGWAEQERLFSRLIYHAVTLRPKSWGCEIDVHYRFPGIGVDADTAFAVLLDHVDATSFAGRLVSVPRQAVHAVVHALHGVRPQQGRGRSEVGVAHARQALEVAGEEVLAIGHAWKCTAALAVALPIAHGQAVLVEADEDVWEWRSDAGKRRYYLAALRGLTAARRAQAVWALIWPTADLVRESEATAGVASRSLLVARLRRLGRGVRAWLR